MTNDCRNCAFNSYLKIDTDWVSCGHPVTLEKQPKWLPGDPAMVNFRTSDVPVRDMHMFSDCPTWSEETGERK